MNARVELDSAQRADLYTTIHKALRAQLCDTLIAAGRLDPHDQAAVDEVLARVRLAAELGRHHLHHENRHVHPLMESRQRGSSAASLREHSEHEEGIERLEAGARALELGRGQAREVAARELYRELALFMAEDFRHMHGEETANNAVLWRHFSDAELGQVHAAIIASADPRLLEACLRWLVSAISPAECAAVLSGMRHAMPAEAFVGVLERAKSLLGEREWAKLLRALGPQPLLP